MSNSSWRDRLIQAIDADGRSDRALSTAARLGPNYIQQMRERGTNPSFEHASKLCEALNLSVVYVLTGLKLDADGEEFIRLASSLSPDQRRSMLDFLRAMTPEKPDA